MAFRSAILRFTASQLQAQPKTRQPQALLQKICPSIPSSSRVIALANPLDPHWKEGKPLTPPTNEESNTLEALLKIAHRIDCLNDRIGKLTSLLLIVMVTVGALNVIASELGEIFSTQLTSNRYLELQWYLYGIIFLLGSAYTLKQNDHVRVDVLYNSWSPKRKAWANLLGSLLFLIPFSSLIITTAIPKVIRSWQRGEMSPDADGLLRAPIKTVVIIGFALLILQGLSEAIKSTAIIRDHSLPPDRTDPNIATTSQEDN